MLRQIRSGGAYRPSRALLLALSSAGLLILSFPYPGWWFCAWFGFVPLLLAVDTEAPGRAFRVAYFTGFLFWLGAIYWLVHVTAAGMVALAAYLALYFGAFGFLCSRFRLLSNPALYFCVPALWVGLEFLRSHLLTGFGWALLGYSQSPVLPLIQVADITGVWGVSFIVMLLNTVFFSCAGYRVFVLGLQRRLLIVVLCVVAVAGYGLWRIRQVRVDFTRPLLSVSVVQPDIPQRLKWDPAARPYILREYARVTALASARRTDLMVWPEAASPVILGDDDAVFYRIAALSSDVGVPFLLGAVRTVDGKYFNSAAIIDPGKGPTQFYDKLHLVPFGEYIPLKSIFPFLEVVVPIGDISAGGAWTRLIHKGVPFSVLICFEDLFPGLARGFVARGAQFLVNITNDAWYERTSAAEQHVQASVFRAVENKVYLVRSANTGVSGIIRPDGSAAYVSGGGRQRIFVSGFVSGDIFSAHAPVRTLFNRFGDWFVLVCACVLAGIVRGTRRRVIQRRAP